MILNSKQIPLINREISWLHFNERVLQEAADETVPLLERLRFLAIFSSNLDEFYRVRVATLTRLVNVNTTAKELLGYSPKKILNQIKERVILAECQFDELYNAIINALYKEKIAIINKHQLNALRSSYVRNYFQEHVLPRLVPIMLTGRKNEDSFPTLKDRRVYFFVKVFRKNKVMYSLLEIPFQGPSRFVILPKEGSLNLIILLDDIIRFCLNELYFIFNHDKIEPYAIQVIRDAELDLDTNVDEKFIDALTKSLKHREKGRPMRLLYESGMPQDMLRYLVEKMNMPTEVLIPGNRYLNFSDFIYFPAIGAAKLEYPPLPSLSLSRIDRRRSIFDQMAKSDFFLCLPYHSYDYVINFLREAAIDPRVVSIHITLYRLAVNSNVINALISAARNGKKVECILELKARFDEEANLSWGKKLAKAGVQVNIGFVAYKVHAKVCLVKREEKGKIVDYAILATGNFNEKTAGSYSDFNLFTIHKDIVSDLENLFASLRRKEFHPDYRCLIVSPLDARKKLMALIDREIEHARKRKKATIILKMNSLSDEEIINKLYEASNAGVVVDLIIRGMCCLVPNKKGFSENIQVRSIVDRFLEHGRIWTFSNNGNEEIYLTSADLMTRNLDRRVEVGFPIYDEKIKKEIKDILEMQLQDNTKSREVNGLHGNLYFSPITSKRHRSQTEIYQYFKDKIE